MQNKKTVCVSKIEISEETGAADRDKTCILDAGRVHLRNKTDFVSRDALTDRAFKTLSRFAAEIHAQHFLRRPRCVQMPADPTPPAVPKWPAPCSHWLLTSRSAEQQGGTGEQEHQQEVLQ